MSKKLIERKNILMPVLVKRQIISYEIIDLFIKPDFLMIAFLMYNCWRKIAKKSLHSPLIRNLR